MAIIPVSFDKAVTFKNAPQNFKNFDLKINYDLMGYSPSYTWKPKNSRSSTAGDFNGDGVMDAASVNGSGGVSVYLQGKYPEKSPPSQYFDLGVFAPTTYAVSVGYFNDDLKLDLVTFNTDKTYSVLLNTTGSVVENPITNNTPSVSSTVVDTKPPVFISAKVNGNALVMTLEDDNLLSTDNAPTSAFSVMSGGILNPVTDVFVNPAAKTIALLLTNSVINSQVVTVAYTDPTNSDDKYALQDAKGSDVASFTTKTVTNKTPAPVVTTTLPITVPTLTFSSDFASVDEGKSVAFTVSSNIVAPTGGFSVPYTLNGTATNPKDYTDSTSTGSITIPAGSKIGTLTLNTIADSLTEDVETIIFTSSNAASVLVNINDTSLSPAPVSTTITLTSSTTSVNEGESVTYTATSNFAPSTPITIPYSVTSNNAVAGSDWYLGTTGNNTATTGSVIIPAGAISGSFTLTTVANNQTDGDSILNVALGNVANANVVTTPVAFKLNDTSVSISSPVNASPAPQTTTAQPSNQNYEDKAPFVYKSNNVQQLDSVTTLLTYFPKVVNDVDYSSSETQQWRTRASSSALAIDLTQTDKLTNQLLLQGQLEANSNSESWYKISLTKATSLQVQDLSTDSTIVNAAIFTNNYVSPSGSYSLYDSTNQLTSYTNVAAGDYYVRIDKSEAGRDNTKINQPIDFKLLINTQPSGDFILPTLNINANQSSVHAELSSTSTKVFYKFSISATSQFTLDTTNFANKFDIGIVQPTANGYKGASAITYSNAPQSHIYSLFAGTYYLYVNSLNPLTNVEKLDIPVISTTPINTIFNSTSPSILKADLTNAKPALSVDSTGNLELTYSFDLKKVDANTAKPSPTVFSDAQKQAARLALQEYANIGKLKFREIPNGASENPDITFTNVSALNGASGDTKLISSADLSNVAIRIDASKISNKSIPVGSDDYVTLLHEIGHSLGLKHPQSYGTGGADSTTPFLLSAKDNEQYTLMSYNTHPYKDNTGYSFYKNTGATPEKTPLLYDVAAIQSLYGSNVNYNAGDNVYKWNKDIDPYMTIWDGGGVDTIDASNQTQKQVIDLRAGNFSSIGAVTMKYSNISAVKLNPPKDNVSIAYNVIIENAVGSNQDDTIIGNSVSNKLTGNLGRDSFVFASKLGEFNIDTITDFTLYDDSIVLNRTIFTNLNKTNFLSLNELLVSNTAINAETSEQRIIFNSSTHYLYYDGDGSGQENSIAFAIIPNISTLNSGQFFIQS